MTEINNKIEQYFEQFSYPIPVPVDIYDFDFNHIDNSFEIEIDDDSVDYTYSSCIPSKLVDTSMEVNYDSDDYPEESEDEYDSCG